MQFVTLATFRSLLTFNIIVSCAMGRTFTSSEYNNSKELHSRYELYWNFDAATQNLSIAVRVQTTGWIGFGISPNGGMPNSDVVIGWVSGGNTTFHDRKVPNTQALPKIDDEQNWFLIEGTEDNGWTTLKFWRLLDTGDSSEDIVIGEGNTRVIYAWNDADPSDNGSPNYHMSNRGSMGVTFVETSQVVDDLDKAETISLVQRDIEIPSDTTTYWCTGFKLPKEIREKEKHMIKYEAVIHPEAEAYVHHMLLYDCSGVNQTLLEEEYEKNTKGGPCYTSPKNAFTDCTGEAVIAAWAVGGSGFTFPSNVSYSFGGPDVSPFWMVQVHYDNPNSVNGTKDRSGFNITYLDEGRMLDAGLLAVGHRVTSEMIVPPRVGNFTVTGTCDPSCTTSSEFCNGVTVFGNVLHTHLAGVALKLTLIQAEGGRRIVLDQNLNWDFNLQEIHQIQPQKIKKGDRLELECVYQTVNRTEAVLGGLATTDEMCLSFLNYYPRIPLTRCYSIPNNLFGAFNTSLSKNGGKQANWKDLLAAKNASILESVNQFDWDQDAVDALQIAYKTAYQPDCTVRLGGNCPVNNPGDQSSTYTIMKRMILVELVCMALVLVFIHIN